MPWLAEVHLNTHFVQGTAEEQSANMNLCQILSGKYGIRWDVQKQTWPLHALGRGYREKWVEEQGTVEQIARKDEAL